MHTITETQGLAIEPRFTADDMNPFDTVKWVRRDAIIQGIDKVIFEQKNVEVPASWSQTATNIVASKYFHGRLGTEERESSVLQLIGRVVKKIATQATTAGYFDGKVSAETFARDLTYLLLHQYVAFNSPVWFNVGCDSLEPENKAENWHWNPETNAVEKSATGYANPQCSACFINSVSDSMSSILDLAKTEGMLFKWGSGSGTNLSPIRGSMEHLSGGGTASGPLSFMRGFDAFAGVIKSGGKTRRAAKMVILDADHPDIEEFIAAKGKEEKKAYALIREGYDGSGPDSEAYNSIFFQNANNSVRVTDEFMQAVVDEADWNLKSRRAHETTKTIKAADLLRQIAEETWRCGDPGMQFDTTINKWHTSKVSGRINASNPCSEYMFLDDSACNLASFNLVKFLDEDGVFDVDEFKAAVRLMTIAMDAVVDLAGYPTEQIAKNSHDYRPVGLGYANLGALLLELGLPYDSVEGRSMAAGITALMGGAAYRASAEIAEAMKPLAAANDSLRPSESGAFPGYGLNRVSFIKVIEKHLWAANTLVPFPGEHSNLWVIEAARDEWLGALRVGLRAGFRNAQVTVLAPTGTIGFMMDCDTTGIEPMLGLVTFKKLVGGGRMTLVNNAVPRALQRLGYDGDAIAAISAHIDANGTIEGTSLLKPEHLPIFDCSLTPSKGTRSIRWQGHLLMMAATQPFLSGAISKTINMPNSSTVDEIAQAYIEAWRQGLKAVAIYRDGSKAAQPLSVQKETPKAPAPAAQNFEPPAAPDLNAPPHAQRHRLPEERASLTHKFGFAGHEGYITVGLYPNGQPGEVFIRMSKEGSTISGLMDSFATLMSVALQHGVPLSVICGKLAHTRFEPSGWTGNEKMGYAKSVMDYLGRWLQYRFLESEQLEIFTQAAIEATASTSAVTSKAAPSLTELVHTGDAPSCTVCGSLMSQSGSCFRCECGATSGCS